jgi:hypothetical protein
MTTKHSAVARAAMRSSICHSCIPLAGLRQSGQLVVPLILQRLLACRRCLDSYVARDNGYIRIAFISDAVDGRSAERGRNTIVRQNDTFLQCTDLTHPGLRHVRGRSRHISNVKKLKRARIWNRTVKLTCNNCKAEAASVRFTATGKLQATGVTRHLQVAQ